MKVLQKLLMYLPILALSLGFTSCSDDDGSGCRSHSLTDVTFKSILEQKGFRFNEQGNLLIDDFAKNTTSLDLSRTEIPVESLKELSILLNLTDVNLSNNGYHLSFDFANLLSQITGVDLRGNELSEFLGLLNTVTQEKLLCR